MEKQRKRSGSLLTGFVIIILGILSVVGIYQFKRADDLALQVENQYAHSFHEMTDYVKDVDVLLKKSMLVSDPKQLSALSSEIYMQTAAAKANLAQLPTSEVDLSGTSKFLSQTGDYTSYLTAKVINDGKITEKEYENLSKLSDYADEVSDYLEDLDERILDRRLNFEKINDKKVYAENGDFLSGMTGLEDTFQDYPALIYDGPFSEHINALEPEVLKGAKNVSREEALDAAKTFFGDGRADVLTLSGEGGGTIETYDFAGQKEDRELCISITKRGGHVLYMLDNRVVNNDLLSMQQATDKAMAFLQKNGFTNMRSSYYEKNANIATINFSAVQDGVILYSDLIKIKFTASK